jgi:hypothetical protein
VGSLASAVASMEEVEVSTEAEAVVDNRFQSCECN